MLAELMLPDQAHVRRQDWTIFFLHKDTSEEEKQAAIDEERRKRREEKQLDNKEESQSDEETQSGDDGSDDEEAKKQSSEAQETQEIEGGEGPPLIYVLNLVNTKQDTTAKRSSEPVLYPSIQSD